MTFELSDTETYRAFSRLGGLTPSEPRHISIERGVRGWPIKQLCRTCRAGVPAWKIGGRSLCWCYLTPMEKPQITAYLKTHCGCEGGGRAVLAKYDLPHTQKDILPNPRFRLG